MSAGLQHVTGPAGLEFQGRSIAAMTEHKITGDMVINEVIKRYPWTLPVFHRLDVDSCCGGARTVAAMAEEHGFELEEVLAELEAAAGASQS
jgi:regulator of cell morphogenesis and NO signaling